MILTQATAAPPLAVRVHTGAELTRRLPALRDFAFQSERVPLGRDPGWLPVLAKGLRHEVFALEAVEGSRTRGVLPLAYVRSMLFGRFLVSLPYLSSNGVAADGADARFRLVDRAVALADELKVRFLELRHEEAVEHPALTGKMVSKVHMRLPLPDFPGPLWEGLSGKVRNQVRKGEKSGLTIAWGGAELLPEFYSVFSRNMRDLGTPVYGRAFFASILAEFPGAAELCVVRADQTPAAAALVLHGKGTSETPSASALREFNPTCANMFMYWKMLERAVLRGQSAFDFGRSTLDGNTYRFKKQWGAVPSPAIWQYYQRSGEMSAVRPENPRYQLFIRIWQRLPVGLTRWIGPPIVRGIP
jgi:serine/alanine adding enzyme